MANAAPAFRRPGRPPAPSNVTPLGRNRMCIDWNHYDPGSHFDELLAAPGQPRAAARGLAQYLRSLSDTDLADRKAAAELAIVEMGITSTVYSEGQNIDRARPFDIVPRVIPALKWTHVERGLRQRLTALNHCIAGAGHHRHLERPRGGRLHLSCSPSGRAQLRHLPDQCLRGRGSPHHAFLELRAHAGRRHTVAAARRTGPPAARRQPAGAAGASGRSHQRRVSAHAGSALAARLTASRSPPAPCRATTANRAQHSAARISCSWPTTSTRTGSA